MSLYSPATVPEILDGALMLDVGHFVGTPRERCDEHNNKFPSVETEVIEPVGGRKHLKGVASNVETCTTQTQDFAPTNSEVVNLTGYCNKGLTIWCGR